MNRGRPQSHGSRSASADRTRSSSTERQRKERSSSTSRDDGRGRPVTGDDVRVQVRATGLGSYLTVLRRYRTQN